MLVQLASKNKVKVVAITRPLTIFLNTDDRREWPRINSMEPLQRTQKTNSRAVDYLMQLRLAHDLTEDSIFDKITHLHNIAYAAGAQPFYVQLKPSQKN